MTPFEVDAFVATEGKTLDALPEWRDGNRAGEKRCSLPIAVDGVQSPVTLELTIRLNEPEYLMALFLTSKRVICRLCMTTGHFDRETGEEIEGSHVHSWEANRPSTNTLPKKLKHGAALPREIGGRDAALAWFLRQNGIVSPAWLPGGWPREGGLL